MRIDPDRRSGRLLLALVIRLLVAVLFLLRRTCRLEVIEGADRVDRIVREDQPVIVAFWHNRSALGANFLVRAMLERGHRFVLVASRSRDGELSTGFTRYMGSSVIRGSSSRGGRAVLSGCYRAVVKDRESPILIPDGPRGPAYELKPGLVALAQMTGAPILPMGFAARKSWLLGSWDRMIVPRPFSRVAAAVGEPITLPRKLTEDEQEAATLRCKAELDRLTRLAEQAVGASDPFAENAGSPSP